MLVFWILPNIVRAYGCSNAKDNDSSFVKMENYVGLPKQVFMGSFELDFRDIFRLSNGF